MPPRNRLSPDERAARSRLARLLHAAAPLLRGSLVTMARVCGKPSCKCARGEKHVSLYLAVRHEGKRKMIYIPSELEDRVRQAIDDGARVDQWLDQISQSFLRELLRLKAPSPRPKGAR
jgi:hypothetical protein